MSAQRKHLSIGPILLTQGLLLKLSTSKPCLGTGVICYPLIPWFNCGPSSTHHQLILSQERDAVHLLMNVGGRPDGVLLMGFTESFAQAFAGIR